MRQNQSTAFWEEKNGWRQSSSLWSSMSEGFPTDFKFPPHTRSYRRLCWENELDWHALLYDGIKPASLRGKFWTVWIKNTDRHADRLLWWMVFLQRRARSDRKREQLNVRTEIREENMSVFLLAVSQPESALNYRPPAFLDALQLMQWCKTHSWGKLNMKYWLKNWFSCCIIEELLISPAWKLEMTLLFLMTKVNKVRLTNPELLL